MPLVPPPTPMQCLRLNTSPEQVRERMRKAMCKSCHFSRRHPPSHRKDLARLPACGTALKGAANPASGGDSHPRLYGLEAIGEVGPASTRPCQKLHQFSPLSP